MTAHYESRSPPSSRLWSTICYFQCDGSSRRLQLRRQWPGSLFWINRGLLDELNGYLEAARPATVAEIDGLHIASNQDSTQPTHRNNQDFWDVYSLAPPQASGNVSRPLIVPVSAADNSPYRQGEQNQRNLIEEGLASYSSQYSESYNMTRTVIGPGLRSNDISVTTVEDTSAQAGQGRANGTAHTTAGENCNMVLGLLLMPMEQRRWYHRLQSVLVFTGLEGGNTSMNAKIVGTTAL